MSECFANFLPSGRDSLQRLFSTFPNGWPGAGLLLLRLGLAIALIYFGIAGPASNSSEPLAIAQNWIGILSGVFLIAGLWTPGIGILIALDKIWAASSLFFSNRPETWVRGFLALLAVSVAMLGPGAWSIDALLFGRKRIDIDRTRGRRSSP